MDKKEFPDEEELVLCTVDKIMGTTVFVKIEEYNKTGVIVTSEVAPGRIRNIRDYVTPNKKIICKVLRLDTARNQIDLSLRRVNQKDARKLLERYNQEKAAMTILKIVSKNIDGIAGEIKKKYGSLFEFLEKSKENESLLLEFFDEEETKKLISLIKEKIKTKKIEVKKRLSISTIAPNGINLIKSSLNVKDARVTYIGSPFYSISTESKDYKDANRKMEKALKEITAKVKEAGGKIEIFEK